LDNLWDIAPRKLVLLVVLRLQRPKSLQLRYI